MRSCGPQHVLRTSSKAFKLGCQSFAVCSSSKQSPHSAQTHAQTDLTTNMFMYVLNGGAWHPESNEVKTAAQSATSAHQLVTSTFGAVV